MQDATWRLTEAPWAPQDNQRWETRFTIANGYLGVRGFPDEAFDAGPSLPGIYIAGVFNPDADGIPELVNVANVLRVDIVLGGRRLVLAPDRVVEYERTLDLRRGILWRKLVYAQGDRRTAVTFERFASLPAHHLLCQSVEITPLNWRGALSLTFWLDPQVRNQSRRHLCVLHAEHPARDRALLVTETRDSRVRIGQAARAEAWVRQARPPEPEQVARKRAIGLRYQARLEPGQRTLFTRTTATYTSRDRDVTSVERDCLGALRDSATWRCGALRRRHTAAWRRRWQEADVSLDGPDEDQRAVRFVTFHLLQACPAADPTVSIGAKALSGEAYRGHVFWDTEIFMLPFFLFTRPAAARRLLAYRWHTLDGAREKAQEAGYAGAMFAWESAATGQETCPLYVPDPKTGEPVRVWCGEIEQHISADVVYGAWHYWQATGDEAFAHRVLTPLAVETARFWASRVEAEDAGYVIRDVIGPDEYHEHVDNNAFTNYMASWNLRLAAELAPDDADAGLWRQIADGLVVPHDDDLGIIAQDDAFLSLEDADPQALSSRVSTEPEKQRMARIWRSQVLKQADVLMLLLLWPDAFSRLLKRACWDYYETRTTHDSTLSASVHSVVASDLGLRR
ncbi:MAG: glycoside hydrolase family 65 protein, partial [Planctomycetota bacterium]